MMWLRLPLYLTVVMTLSTVVFADVLNVPDDYDEIQDAVDDADDGDSILVESGNYDPVLIRNLDGITLLGMGLDAEDPSVIDGGNYGTCTIELRNANDIEIAGFEIDGGYTGIYCNGADNVWIHHNYIHDASVNYASSISMGIGACSNILVERNIMVRSQHYGVFMNGALGGDVEDITIQNNVISDHGVDGIYAQSVDNLTVRNNAICWNARTGINRISGKDQTFQYNLVYDNRNADFAGFNPDETNIDDNPEFEDADEDDYHLTEDSPCIDAGDPDSPLDPDGSTSDIGCYFFGFRIQIDVIPDTISVGYLPMDSVYVTEIAISAHSENDFDDLTFFLQEAEDYSWLAIDNDEFELGNDDTVRSEIIIEYQDSLEIGTYNGDVLIFLANNEQEWSRIPVSVEFVEGFATLNGRVMDLEEESGIAGAEVELLDYANTTADSLGYYTFPIVIAGDYNLSVNIPDYLPFYQEVSFEPDEDVELNIEMLYANLVVETDEVIVDIDVDSTQIAYLTVSNSGNGTLLVQPGRELLGGGNLEEWDLRFDFNIEEITGDNTLQGVEFDGENFYVSGFNDHNGGKIYVVNRDGELINSFDQFSNSRWGMRDLAFDGEYLYGGDGNTIYRFSTDGELDSEIDGPVLLCRAMTWDSENKLLWVADLESNIFGLDSAGYEEEEFEIDDPLNIFGLATYPDDPDGYTIYAFCLLGDYDTRIMKMDPESGEWMYVADIETDDAYKAGGACIFRHWDNVSWVFSGIARGDDDHPDMLNVWHVQAHTGWLQFDDDPFELEAGADLSLPLTFIADGYEAETEISASVALDHNGRGDRQLVPVTMRVTLDVDDADVGSLLPQSVELLPPHPNPFNNQTRISYTLPSADFIALELYTLDGRLVSTIFEGHNSAGQHFINFNAGNLPSSVYIVKLTAGEISRVVKAVLIQ